MDLKLRISIMAYVFFFTLYDSRLRRSAFVDSPQIDIFVYYTAQDVVRFLDIHAYEYRVNLYYYWIRICKIWILCYYYGLYRMCISMCTSETAQLERSAWSVAVQGQYRVRPL